MGNVLRRPPLAAQNGESQDSLEPENQDPVLINPVSGYWNMGPPNHDDLMDITDPNGDARSTGSFEELSQDHAEGSNNNNHRRRRRRRSPSLDADDRNAVPDLFTTSPNSIDNDAYQTRSIRPRLDLESVEIAEHDDIDVGVRVGPRRSRRLAGQRARQVLHNLQSTSNRSSASSNNSSSYTPMMSQEPTSGASSVDFDSASDGEDADSSQTDNQLASQGILRHALEHVLYHVLEEQTEIRRTGTRDGHDVGDENIVVQLFYYLGTFHVDTSRPANVSGLQDDIQSSVSVGVESRDETNGTEDAAPSETHQADSSTGRISGNFNAIRNNGTLLRETHREWLSSRAMRTELVHFSRDSLNTEDEHVISLPLVMFGAREVPANSANQNGWIMYVIGGAATSNALRSIARLTAQSSSAPLNPGEPPVLSNNNGSSSNNYTAASTQTEEQTQSGQIVGTNGTILMITRNRSTEVGTENQSPAAPSNAPTNEPEPAIITNGADGHSLRLIVSSLLAGLQDQQTATGSAENFDFLNALNASFAISEASDQNRDNYDLFWSLSNLIGYARPRHVPLADIERNLEVVKYRNIQNNNSSSAIDNRCPICLVEYNDEDDMRLLECSHCFHKSCIDTWLSQYVNSCPLCRDEVISRNKPAEEGEDDQQV